MKNFKLFIELSDEEAEKVRGLGAKRGPVLNHLFKGKERVFFPLPPDPELYKLKKILESIPHPRHPDMKKYKVSMADLRAGQVRLLQKAKHPEKGEYISDKNTTTIARALGNERENEELKDGNFEMVWNDIQPYWVVVSRHPIDVKRMADFSNLQSCHTFGGAYYDCTDQEVESGGAVAYLIHPGDFAKTKQDADEIFVDKGFKSANSSGEQIPGRNIEGITPVARTRIRRLHSSQQNKEIGVVEDAVYGIDETGHLAQRFIKALRQWVLTKQDDHPDNADAYDLKGGEYEDSSPRKLHKGLYGHNPVYMTRFIQKLSDMTDEAEIRKELRRFTGGSEPAVITRMGGKRIWVGNQKPRHPYTLFQTTWLAHLMPTNHSNTLIDPNRIMALLGESDTNTVSVAGELEKYIINMLNRSGDAKLVKMGNGWVIITPLEHWLTRIKQDSSSGAQRLDRQIGNPEWAAAAEAKSLAQNLSSVAVKRKLMSLLGNPQGAKTGEFEVGEIVFHPHNGKAVVTQGASRPGESVQVKWFKDNSYNFVPQNLLYRNEGEAAKVKKDEDERREQQRLAWDQRRMQRQQEPQQPARPAPDRFQKQPPR